MAKLDTFIKIDVDGKAAVAELGRVEKAADDVDNSVKDMGDGEALEGLSSGLDALEGKLGAIAGPAAVGAVVTGLYKAADAAAQVAIDAGTMASALDISTEEASAMNAAFSDVGLEMNDTVDIALQIGSAVADDADLARALGLEVGKAVKPTEALRAGIDRWDFLTPTQRAKAFGEEGVRQIARLTSEGKSLDEILASVEGSRIIDDQELREAQEFKATVADITGLWKSLVVVIGQEVVSAIGDASSAAEDFKGVIPESWWQGFGDVAAQAYDRVKGGLVGVETGLYDVVAAEVEAGNKAGDYASVADSSFGIAESAADDVTDAIGDIESAYDILTGQLDNKEAYINLQQAFADVQKKAEDAWIATAEGADDATAKQLIYQESLITAARLVGEYGLEIADLPEDVVTELVAAVAEGDLAKAQALMSKPVTVKLIPTFGTALSNITIPYTVAAPRTVAPTNVTINTSRTMSAREISLIASEWTNANG